MNLCIIPARGGSKRIPRKNIKKFNGKPIIAYSIEAAIDSNCFDRIIVSTDDEEISEISAQYGAEVPFIRPKELSNDYASTLEVIKHSIEWFENIENISFDFVCCLYATAPFVSAKLIDDVYKEFLVKEVNYCFTATKYEYPIQRALKMNKNKTLEMFNPDLFLTRSQDLDDAFHDAGQLYWGKASSFKAMKAIFSEESSPFILPSYLVQDIDTKDDWIRAELIYNSLFKE